MKDDERDNTVNKKQEKYRGIIMIRFKWKMTREIIQLIKSKKNID